MSRRLAILFLSGWCPYPLDNGTRIRQYHLLNHLAEHHDVTLCTFIPSEEWRASSAVLGTFCRKVIGISSRPYRPQSAYALLGLLSPAPRSLVSTFSREMSQRIKQETTKADYDVFIAGEIGQALYVDAARARVAILDDIEAASLYDQTRPGQKWHMRARHHLTRLKYERFLQRVLRRYCGCTVVSEKEKGLLRPLLPPGLSVAIVPNGVDIHRNVPGLAEPRPNSLVFCGSMLYSANWDGMDWFLREIYPQVRARVPDVSLVITGRHNGVLPGSLHRYSNITFTGFVDDVRPQVASSAVAIVPLRQGSGTRLKILESMALGVPVVSTLKGIEGLQVVPGQDVLVADQAQKFTESIVRVLRDIELRRTLILNARRCVETRYDWSAIGAQFSEFIESMAISRVGNVCS